MELSILAELLRHADNQINSSTTIFMTILGVVATFCSTQAFRENFHWPLKLALSACLTVMLVFNRDEIIQQMVIYNELLTHFPEDREPWKSLFSSHGVFTELSTSMMYWVHAISSTVIHLFVWSKELKGFISKYI